MGRLATGATMASIRKQLHRREPRGCMDGRSRLGGAASEPCASWTEMTECHLRQRHGSPCRSSSTSMTRLAALSGRWSMAVHPPQRIGAGFRRRGARRQVCLDRPLLNELRGRHRPGDGAGDERRQTMFLDGAELAAGSWPGLGFTDITRPVAAKLARAPLGQQITDADPADQRRAPGLCAGQHHHVPLRARLALRLAFNRSRTRAVPQATAGPTAGLRCRPTASSAAAAAR